MKIISRTFSLTTILLLPLSTHALGFELFRNGSGHAITKNFTTEAFNQIEVNGDFKVVVVPGARNVELFAEDNLFDEIELTSQKNTLTLDSSWRIKPTIRPVLTVSMADLQKLQGSGSVLADLSFSDNVTKFALNLSGASNAKIHGKNIGDLNVKLDGSSSVEVAGQIKTCNIDAHGSIKGTFSETHIDRLVALGSGSIDLNFGKVREASGQLQGVSSITYKVPPETGAIKTSP